MYLLENRMSSDIQKILTILQQQSPQQELEAVSTHILCKLA